MRLGLAWGHAPKQSTLFECWFAWSPMNKVYQVITNRIIDLLEAGTVPWHKPWGGPDSLPKSLVSGREYRGINSFILHSACYESPYWLSFKQAGDRGGHIRKGEHGYPCVYWNWVENVDKETGEIKNIPFLKYYTVFNVEQCVNLEYPRTENIENEFEPISNCERVINHMPHAPKIAHQGRRACYTPSMDTVNMPKPESFESPEDYYSVLFHELVHSTGHETRLARYSLSKWAAFGSPKYSKEELVAEMGATFLCGVTGIENQVIDNSASYIQHWLNRLKEDAHFIIPTAGQAQKAVDYILDRSVK